MNKGLEALEDIKESVDLFDRNYQWDKEFSNQFDENIDIIEKELKALEIIKSAEFSLEFDESQNEWSLYIFNGKQGILVARGTGIKTHNLLKEVLL